MNRLILAASILMAASISSASPPRPMPITTHTDLEDGGRILHVSQPAGMVPTGSVPIFTWTTDGVLMTMFVTTETVRMVDYNGAELAWGRAWLGLPPPVEVAEIEKVLSEDLVDRTKKTFRRQDGATRRGELPVDLPDELGGYTCMTTDIVQQTLCLQAIAACLYSKTCPQYARPKE